VAHPYRDSNAPRRAASLRSVALPSAGTASLERCVASESPSRHSPAPPPALQAALALPLLASPSAEACSCSYRKAPGRRSQVIVSEVSLDAPLEDLYLVASWYTPVTDGTRREYAFGSTVQDTHRYSLQHLLGLPRIEYHPETRRYTLAEPERTLVALDEALRAGSTRTIGEAAQAERQLYASCAAVCLLRVAHYPRCIYTSLC
jgi:hypothetical protein